MTLFLRTGAVRTRLYSIIGAVWVVTALLAASLPASAATLADLAGPLRDVAALDAVGALTPNTVAARVAGVRNGRVLVQVLFRSPASVNGGAVGRLGGQIHQIRDRRMEEIGRASCRERV